MVYESPELRQIAEVCLASGESEAVATAILSIIARVADDRLPQTGWSSCGLADKARHIGEYLRLMLPTAF